MTSYAPSPVFNVWGWRREWCSVLLWAQPAPPNHTQTQRQGRTEGQPKPLPAIGASAAPECPHPKFGVIPRFSWSQVLHARAGLLQPAPELSPTCCPCAEPGGSHWGVLRAPWMPGPPGPPAAPPAQLWALTLPEQLLAKGPGKPLSPAGLP